jgi:hypothetical protein
MYYYALISSRAAMIFSAAGAILLASLATLRETLFRRVTENEVAKQVVDAAYREWLGRDPDPEGRAAYVERLAKGGRREVIESLLQSDEFRLRPLRVLVVPDHRVFNAATLQYLAESERRPLSFRRADLSAADAAIVEGGPQGPWRDVVSGIVEAIRPRGKLIAFPPMARGSWSCPCEPKLTQFGLRNFGQFPNGRAWFFALCGLLLVERDPACGEATTTTPPPRQKMPGLSGSSVGPATT